MGSLSSKLAGSGSMPHESIWFGLSDHWAVCAEGNQMEDCTELTQTERQTQLNGVVGDGNQNPNKPSSEQHTSTKPTERDAIQTSGDQKENLSSNNSFPPEANIASQQTVEKKSQNVTKADNKESQIEGASKVEINRDTDQIRNYIGTPTQTQHGSSIKTDNVENKSQDNINAGSDEPHIEGPSKEETVEKKNKIGNYIGITAHTLRGGSMKVDCVENKLQNNIEDGNIEPHIGGPSKAELEKGKYQNGNHIGISADVDKDQRMDKKIAANSETDTGKSQSKSVSPTAVNGEKQSQIKVNLESADDQNSAKGKSSSDIIDKSSNNKQTQIKAVFPNTENDKTQNLNKKRNDSEKITNETGCDSSPSVNGKSLQGGTEVKARSKSNQPCYDQENQSKIHEGSDEDSIKNKPPSETNECRQDLKNSFGRDASERNLADEEQQSIPGTEVPPGISAWNVKEVIDTAPEEANVGVVNQSSLGDGSHWLVSKIKDVLTTPSLALGLGNSGNAGKEDVEANDEDEDEDDDEDDEDDDVDNVEDAEEGDRHIKEMTDEKNKIGCRTEKEVPFNFLADVNFLSVSAPMEKEGSNSKVDTGSGNKDGVPEGKIIRCSDHQSGKFQDGNAYIEGQDKKSNAEKGRDSVKDRIVSEKDRDSIYHQQPFNFLLGSTIAVVEVAQSVKENAQKKITGVGRPTWIPKRSDSKRDKTDNTDVAEELQDLFDGSLLTEKEEMKMINSKYIGYGDGLGNVITFDLGKQKDHSEFFYEDASEKNHDGIELCETSDICFGFVEITGARSNYCNENESLESMADVSTKEDIFFPQNDHKTADQKRQTKEDRHRLTNEKKVPFHDYFTKDKIRENERVAQLNRDACYFYENENKTRGNENRVTGGVFYPDCGNDSSRLNKHPREHRNSHFTDDINKGYSDQALHYVKSAFQHLTDRYYINEVSDSYSRDRNLTPDRKKESNYFMAPYSQTPVSDRTDAVKEKRTTFEKVKPDSLKLYTDGDREKCEYEGSYDQASPTQSGVHYFDTDKNHGYDAEQPSAFQTVSGMSYTKSEKNYRVPPPELSSQVSKSYYNVGTGMGKRQEAETAHGGSRVYADRHRGNPYSDARSSADFYI